MWLALLFVSLGRGGCIIATLTISSLSGVDLLRGPLRPAQGPCLLRDLSGDGVGEVGVLLYRGAYHHQQAAVLDGATGEVRWQGAPGRSGETGLFCPSPDHLVVKPGAEFRVDVYAAADGSMRSLRLPDTARGWAPGNGCFVVYASGGEARGFRLEDPVVGARCNPTLPRRSFPNHPSYAESISIDNESVHAAYGDARYQLSFRERGSELVQVSREGGWSRELQALGVPNSGRAALVPVPGGVVVIAGLFPEPPNDEVAQILRLDAETGETV